MITPHKLCITRILCTLLLSTAVLANAASAEDIIVSSVQGDVRVMARATDRRAEKGMKIELPASIDTGPGASIELRQGQTTVKVAADTRIEIPATAANGALIERVLQTKGNAFYDIAKRKSKKLQVQTPFLVAVVKGTQFNVAIQPTQTTVSLFEGRLEIRTPDGSSVVNLEAGEIATRSASDQPIHVLPMSAEEPTAQHGSGSTHGGQAELTLSSPVSGSLSPLDGPGSLQPQAEALLAGIPAALDTTVDVGVNLAGDAADSGVEVGADLGGTEAVPDLDGGTAHSGADVGIDLNGGGVDLGTDVGVDLDGGSVDLGTDVGVGLGGGAVDVGVDVGIELGEGSVELGVDAGVDLGSDSVDVGADADVDLGNGSVDLDADVGVDLGSGSVDLGTDADVDLGENSVEVGADAGVDLGNGAVDLGADVDIGDTEVGVDAGVDVGSGEVGADVDLGGADVDLDVDLGDGTIDVDVGSDSGSDGDGGGGLLDGLGGLLGGP